MIMLQFARIHPDKVGKLLAWMDELGRREKEAHETMAADTITHEVAYLLDVNDGPIFVSAMFAEDPEHADRMRFASTHPIAEKYREVMHDVLLEVLDPKRVFEARLQ
jgi:Family of unknown function (DUF6176)